MECRVVHHLQLHDIDGIQTNQRLVIGQVIGVHLDESAIVDGVVDYRGAEPGGAPRRAGRLRGARRDLPDDPARVLVCGRVGHGSVKTPMINVEHIESWRGQPVLDPAGEQLGKLEEIYLDRSSGTPLLATIKSGLLGRRSKLVPLDGASVSPDYVRLVHDQATVESAPEAAGEAAPDAAALDAVGAAYGLKFSERVELETSGEAEARRAEAEAARARADQLAGRCARQDRGQRRRPRAGAWCQRGRHPGRARGRGGPPGGLAAREKAQRYDD